MNKKYKGFVQVLFVALLLIVGLPFYDDHPIISLLLMASVATFAIIVNSYLGFYTNLRGGS